jgi:ERCC4-related helicase
LQRKLINQISRGYKNYSSYRAVSDCSMAIKIAHAIELLETQTLQGTHSYLKEIYNQAEKKQSKGVEKLANKQVFNTAFAIIHKLNLQGEEHPKIKEIIKIIKKEISEKKNSKIIIFAQYRETAKVIVENLNKLKDIKSKMFIGQAKKKDMGLSQKEQKNIIDEFKDKKINVIVSTSIGEEGLDIPEVDTVIFYEPTSSAIRSIQRRGRTARLEKGKLIILITKNTKDQTSHYASRSREKRMTKSIETIKKELKNKEKQKKLI